MRRFINIIEAPLGDYEVISKHNYKTKKLKPQLKTLQRVFDRVDFKVNIYFGSNIEVPYNSIYGKESYNRDYYIRITPEELKELELPISSPAAEDMTIIFVNGSEFELTAWGIIHDIVHALTSEQINNNLLEEAEKYIDNFISLITNQKIKSWKSNYHTNNHYNTLFTFKSARDKTLRPVEAGTELMTQYMMTGDIKFNLEYVPEKFRPKLEKISIKIKENFQKIIENGKGKIYLTSA